MIKPKTLLLSFLFLPYLFWIIASIFMTLPLNSVLNSIVASISIIYSIGIAFWGIPYTLLLFAFILWSKNKPWKLVYKKASHLPIALSISFYAIAFLLWLAFAIVSIFNQQFDIKEFMFGSLNLIWYASIAAVVSFFYGLAIVGLGKIFFLFVDFLGLINHESEFLDEITFEQAILENHINLKELK